MSEDEKYIQTYDKIGHKHFGKGSDKQLREWGNSEERIREIKIQCVKDHLKFYKRGIDLYKTLCDIENKENEMEKLSFNIKRSKKPFFPFKCYYTYEFSTSQWLEKIDNPEYFGISHNDMKEKVIDSLISEFKVSLNNVVFGDPAGYIEKKENDK